MPLRADVQLDLYTNRPFAKVFAATDAVGEDLRPLWAGVADPYPDAPAKPRWALWLRLPVQAALLALIAWCTAADRGDDGSLNYYRPI